MSPDRIPADWPHRGASRFVRAGGLVWHVQRFGAGPALLLVHGTAASTHSFRALAQALSGEFEIVMADLPGHGFSGAMAAPRLPDVAGALGELVATLGVEPALAVGHSAGAAIVIRMTLDGVIRPQALVGLAPALKPFGGAADGLASTVAQLAFVNPLMPRVFAMRANPQRVGRLIANTGSALEADGTAYYARLLQRHEHVGGALRLMANWNLRQLIADLGALDTPLTLAVGEKDRATPPRDVQAAARRAPAAEVIRLPGLGHLAHEEDPAGAADIIRRALATESACGGLQHA